MKFEATYEHSARRGLIEIRLTLANDANECEERILAGWILSQSDWPR